MEKKKNKLKLLYPKLNFIENPKEDYWSSVALDTVYQPQMHQIWRNMLTITS